MKHNTYLLFFFLFLFGMSDGLWAQAESTPKVKLQAIDMQRVKEIADMLPDVPFGLGDTYKNRAAWDKLYATGKYKRTMNEAEKMLREGFPVWDQKLYDRVFTDGDTQSGKDMINNRLKCLSILVWAGCLENKGRFTKMVKDAIYDIMKQKTWVNPKHYYKHNYKGFVELATALNAVHLSQAVYLLDDKLPAKLRTDLLAELYTRAFHPLLGTITGKNKDHWWLTGTNNWNAACLDGVTCAALTLIPDKLERAKYAAIAERYIQNFIAGFLDDGYCTEGLGYYNFGIMHYITLREKLWLDTGGKLDLFQQSPEKIYKIACFPSSLEIINGIYPAIADCKTGSSPSRNIMRYLNRTVGLQLPSDKYYNEGLTFNMSDCIINVFPRATKLDKQTAVNKEKETLRSYFPYGGLLIVRTDPKSSYKMGVALKGGNNNEHHNHNDIGSYTMVVGKETMIEDPGLVPYDSRTFSPERYTAFKTLASYGHPVPYVAGMEQIDGKKAEAKIIKTEFSESTDIFAFDFTSAYPVSSLKQLTRTFVFHRAGEQPALEVVDKYSFSKPEAFETALITRAKWQKSGENTLLLMRGKERVQVNIDTDRCTFDIKEEVISEKGKPYTRLGIVLRDKRAEGKIKVTYRVLEKERPAAMLWNYENMLRIKKGLKSGDKTYELPYKQLIKEATALLKCKAPSVMDKPDECVAISGNKHDFITVGKYSWPNPDTPDGKPWFQKDGVRNPNYKKYDATYQVQMCRNVVRLSAAYFFSDDERFAKKAVEHLKVWFINANSKMTPHLLYAQVIPGNDGDMGHAAGIIEGRIFVDVLSSIGLLESSSCYTERVDNDLKVWFRKFNTWLTTSKVGKEESRTKNNHAVAYDELLISISLFLRDNDTAFKLIDGLHSNRLYKQIEPDGKMPLELARSLGHSYSEYNLIHMLEICEMAKPLLPALYHRTSDDGRCIGKALDFIATYQGKTENGFAPYRQISGWDNSQQQVCWLLYRARHFDPSKNYEELFRKYWIEKPGHINLLLY